MPMNYRLQRMTAADAAETVRWMVEEYGFAPTEVEEWVEHLHFNWPMSVKAVDAQGETIGLLNMSDYRIEEETAQMADEKPQLLHRLNAMRYTAVFSFIVAEEYRHTRLNYDMVMSLMTDWVGTGAGEGPYDFVFIPVMHRLKTHRYWQRWGAVEFYRDVMSVYYMLPLSDAAKEMGEMVKGGSDKRIWG